MRKRILAAVGVAAVLTSAIWIASCRTRGKRQVKKAGGVDERTRPVPAATTREREPAREPPEIVLARGGQAKVLIAVAADASPSERHAAEELARFLKQVTGAEFRVGTPDDAPPQIAVGPGAARELLPELALEGLGADGIVMRASPPHLVLTGGRGAPRGTPYAVYTFLEEQAGCRWWTPKASTIPSRPVLTIPGSLDVRYVPPFERRDQCFREGFDADWSVRMKYNGWTGPGDDEKRGGTLSYAGGFAHTFYKLVPPSKHFEKHPEWYSERDGRRFHKHGQLCVMNRELLAFAIKRVKQWLRDKPKAAYVSVTQNDWDGHCLCAGCRRVEEEEGSPAGPLLRFVNAIAEAIEPEFPHVAVDTFAYQYTRKPPRITKPRHNVVVRLCSIECSFAQPLEDDKNRAFREDIEGWAKVCERLYVWDYVTNFTHYIQPHPNLRALGQNVRFFAKNNVKGLFEQGNYSSLGGEFGSLRAWVLGKLLWNPELDENALIDEFLRGYYGDAAPFIKEYIDLVHDKAAETDYYMRCFTPVTAPFLTFDVMTKSEALFRQAEAAVAGDPPDATLRSSSLRSTSKLETLKHVQVAHLPVRYVCIMRWPTFKLAAATAGRRWEFPATRVQAIAEFERVCKENGITHLAEHSGRPVSTLRKDFGDSRRESASPPPGGREKGSWIDLQDDLFGLYRRGKLSDLKADEKASDGMAAWMPLTHREWAVQLRLDAPEFALRGEWTAYVVVRVDKGGTEGRAFTSGIYDTKAKKSAGQIAVEAKDLADAEYHTYRIADFTPRPSMYLWAAPPEDKGSSGAMWVDRFFLVRRR